MLYGSFREKFCGNSNPGPFTSTGQNMTVRFHTDGSVTETGFSARWMEVAEVETSSTWREDWRCGPDNPLEDGSPATCNPSYNFCCSEHGWCGETAAHCDCGSCVDYRPENAGDVGRV